MGKYKSTLKIIAILSVILTSNLYSQKIEWNRLSFGFNISYLMVENDIVENWNKSIVVGGELQYKLSEQFFVGFGMHFSNFVSKNEASIPSFYFLSIPMEFKTLFPILSKIKLLVAGGIQNNTFVFIRDAAEKVGDNNIESEFGVFLTLGIRTRLWSIEGIEIYTKYQTVFTSPKTTEFINIGIRIFF